MATLDEIESHLIRNTLKLAGKKVYIKEGTVYKEQLTQLANSIADSIIILFLFLIKTYLFYQYIFFLQMPISS